MRFHPDYAGRPTPLRCLSLSYGPERDVRNTCIFASRAGLIPKPQLPVLWLQGVRGDRAVLSAAQAAEAAAERSAVTFDTSIAADLNPPGQT